MPTESAAGSDRRRVRRLAPVLGAAVWVGAAGSAPLALPVRPPPEAGPRTAARRALAFVTRDGQRWIREQRCASCHHAPLFIWSLGEAERRGFPVDRAALDRITEAAVRAYVEQGFRPTAVDTAPLSLGALYLLLGAGASAAPGDPKLRPLLDHVRASQLPDGSWAAPDLLAPDLEAGRRPPLYDTRQVTTGWALWALGREPDASEDPAVAAGLEWLDRHPPGKGTQPAALRVLLARRYRPARVDAAVRELLAGQRPDGGWGQTAAGPSDAFATGQALYALGRAEAAPARRAWGYLVETQQADGSWRVPSPGDQGIATTYAGTAWAALGLTATLQPPARPGAEIRPAPLPESPVRSRQ